MRKIFFLLCCVALGLWAGPKAEWIIYPEELDQGVNQKRYLRTEFDVQNKTIKKAAIYYAADDSGHVWMNGKAIESQTYRLTDFPTSVKNQYDVTRYMTQGARNAIFADATNGGGPGGFILHLLITFSDGTIQEIFTDTTSWKASKVKTTGSDKANFTETSDWKTPYSAGDYDAETWTIHYDMIALFAYEDALAELERRQIAEENLERLMEELKNAPMEQAKVEYVNGGARFNIGGKLYRPILYNTNFGWRDTAAYSEKIANFAAADMNLISFGIEAGTFWKGTNNYDYDALDEALHKAFIAAPNARFLFDIGFAHGPSWWNTQHPEETIRYARYDESKPSDDCIGNYSAPSYASELWLQEASEVVRLIVEHIENSPYGKHVFGYRLDAGVYMEWHYYGMAGAMPDVSEPMIKFFRKFLFDKYNGDVSRLREAWGQSVVTFDNALPPPVEVRLNYLYSTMRHPVKNAWSIDFLQCIQQSLKNALLTLNKTAKEACNGRALVGNYCGYFFGMSYTAEGWHLVNDDLIRSPYVDFQVAPCNYGTFFRGMGSSQMARSLMASYRLHNKIGIFEADGRTTLASPTEDSQMYTTSLQEDVAMLSRDLAQAISKGCAYWYYDFGKNWYNDPKILQFFHNVAPVYDSIKDFSSAAEIAIIGDWESVYYHAIQYSKGDKMQTYLTYDGGLMTYAGTSFIPRSLKVGGMQYDAYSFGDIDNPALQNYKVYIFPQLCYMTPEKLAKLNTLKKAGKTLIFLGTPGWLTPEGPDDNSIYETTGIRAEILGRVAQNPTTTLNNGTTMMAVGLEEKGMYYAPVLKITDSSATKLGTVTMSDDNSKVYSYAKKTSSDGCTVYLSSSPIITTPELRRIAQEAGVHIYCDSDNGVVFANNSMISFHTATSGTYTLKAKTPVKWTMVYPEKRTYSDTQAELTFTVSQPDTYIFTIE